MTVKNVEKLEKSRVAVTVEVGAEEFEAAVAKAYAKARGKLSIPGFRPGKAPRKMIEKLYGAGNGDTLLLAAGQLLREMLFAVHDRHPFHCFLYLFLSLGSRYTHVEQRKFYILVYIQLVDQIETLEDEPDNPFAQFRPLGFRISGYFDPVQVIFSAGRVVEQS